MKNHKLAGSIALLLTALGAASAAAQTTTASILFTRPFYRSTDGARAMLLDRVKPSGAGVARLAPLLYGVDYRRAGWSPSGAAVVYEASQQSSAWQHSQLYVVDRQGGPTHRITAGPGTHTFASWGPNGTVAFITDDNQLNHDCLGTVRADGTHQRILFCPPREAGMTTRYMALSAPQWAASGKSVYVTAGTDEGGLEPRLWFSNVYRVNVSTGAAVKLAGQVFEGINTGPEYSLTIAPDGTHGVYDSNPMNALDFAINTLTPLASGGGYLRYSKDGRKIAFARQEGPGIGHLHVYVMRADGSHIHPALVNPDPDADYTPVDWSFDGTRLLVNKWKGDTWLQIVDLRNNTARTVVRGTADNGAWFHP
ncbi:MAG TPA: hypothetical protein VFH59_05950 [Frateuria sp.]|uniref:TolB family protein n=1 Tax=Frateuria sp. TaxID=2211372 RepID=UPI002D7E8B7C|nr:hypothetical protein [Frateuria sp.]HET6804973.1 hypothetical protein [Frateuria sp.]